MSLPVELQSYVDGPPGLDAAKALVYDRALGLALVEALADKRLRSHLEALGEVASDKEVKKAARKIAYKLKSAGVSGGVRREASIDMSLKIETERVAAASAPGFDGRLWLVLPSLPGAGGGEIDLREGNQEQRVEAIADLSLGRVRKFQSEAMADKVLQAPIMVGLDLAARLVTCVEVALKASGRPVPVALGHMSAWRDRAVELGADPERASARARFGASSAPASEEQIARFEAHPLQPFMAAPASAFDDIDTDFRSLMHGQDEIDKADFIAKASELTSEAAKRWAASKDKRSLAEMWLDATADVMLADGDEETARISLALADELAAWDGADPLEQRLVARAFRGAIDLEAAWLHREAHMRGQAQH
jgi:hypothetical protein